MGYILLAGGSEFGGQMEECDRRAIQLAGGSGARICIVPTAAVPDDNHERAGNNGVRWFRSLGAVNVSLLPLIDSQSANDERWVREVEDSRLIYILGGFPRYLEVVLRESRVWEAIRKACGTSAVLAGSSAGAMVLCQWYFDPRDSEVRGGLELLEKTCMLPHHDTFGQSWVSRLKGLPSDTLLMGIDEKTGVIDDGPEGRWRVYGKGAVTLYRTGRSIQRFDRGQCFQMEARATAGHRGAGS
jgi:cyanophycinase